MGTIIFQIAIIIVLTCINAFFAATEMAVVSINKTTIKIKADEGDKKAVLLYKMLSKPSKFLATIQVAITLAGFFSSAFAATGLSSWLAVLLEKLNVPYSNQLALVITTILLSFFMLLFGELFPKRLALQKKEAIARFAIGPTFVIAKIFAPFVHLLSACTKLLMKLTGLKTDPDDGTVSEAEIRSMVKAGHLYGTIKPGEEAMINNVFEFDDKMAREIMTPRLDVTMLNIMDHPEELINAIVQEKYSRIPVYNQDKDRIIGFILVKEVLRDIVKNGRTDFDMRQFIHEPYFVPETKQVDRLFKDMKDESLYFAILIDEYGVFTGIVTMEDLIEEVVGDISDEFDFVKEDICKIDDRTYEVSGKINLQDFNQYFETAYEPEDYDTLSGMLIHEIGEIPHKDYDTPILLETMTFEILSMSENRIQLVRVRKV